MDPYIYQYSIGGLIFIVGMIYAARQGFIGFTARGMRNLILMLGGMIFFMVIQGYLQYAPMTTAKAVTSPSSVQLPGVVGKPIDYAVMILYMAAILAIGIYFGRNNKTTKDFFFGGQR